MKRKEISLMLDLELFRARVVSARTPNIASNGNGRFYGSIFLFHVPLESLQATLFPRISFPISGQDLTKIHVLVRLTSITWLRTVHETATKAAEVTYGYELCKRTSCMTSDRETRPWPRANSFHQPGAASAEYSHRVCFILRSGWSGW